MEIVLEKEFVKLNKSGDKYIITLKREDIINEIKSVFDYVMERLEEGTEEDIHACLKTRDWSNIKNSTDYYYQRKDELREITRVIKKIDDFMEQYME